ncbi:hypothetical protein ABH940_001608 [Streptacidiphilus sp. BW17]
MIANAVADVIADVNADMIAIGEKILRRLCRSAATPFDLG